MPICIKFVVVHYVQKGTFDICGVECCVYEKDAVETAKEQVQEEKTDVVRPAVDESITEHERKRSRVETR